MRGETAPQPGAGAPTLSANGEGFVGGKGVSMGTEYEVPKHPGGTEPFSSNAGPNRTSSPRLAARPFSDCAEKGIHVTGDAERMGKDYRVPKHHDGTP